MAKDISGPIQDEIMNLLRKYCEDDPNGDWNDAEWEVFVRNHASSQLLAYMKEKGKYWFYAKSRTGPIHV